MTDPRLTTKRINPGIYEIRVGSRRFIVEQTSHQDYGTSWQLCEEEGAIGNLT